MRPVVVLLVGPTGAGKSTIFNTIAGRAASSTGVLRPTTRVAVILVHPDDQEALVDGALAGIAPEQVRLVTDDAIEPGLVLIDAPDIDSLEHANRALTDRLVEAADLCVFVTTATRYADQVPWSVLAARPGARPAAARRRQPHATRRRRPAEVLADVRRLLAEAGLDGLLADGRDATPRDLVAVRGGRPGCRRRATGRRPPSRRCSTRSRGCVPTARRASQLAARALTGSLAGLGESLDRIADDADHETIDVEALRRLADRAYDSGLVALRQEIGQGTFLREEALRHWQSFVGADQMTRFFSEGIGRIRGAIIAALRPATAPVAEVRAATTDDLLAVARLAGRRGRTADRDGMGRRARHGPGHGRGRRPVAPLPRFRHAPARPARGLDREHRRGHPAERPLEADPGTRRVGRGQRPGHRA